MADSAALGEYSPYMYGWAPGSLSAILLDRVAKYEVGDCDPKSSISPDDPSINWEPCIILGEKSKRLCDVQIAADGAKFFSVPRRYVRDRRDFPSEEEYEALLNAAKAKSIVDTNQEKTGQGMRPML